MKKLVLFFSFSLILISCEKDKIIQNPEIPYWLQDRIARDEEMIKSNPQSGLDIAAWIRYEYAGNYYFEYHNLLSSAGPPAYNYDGTQLVFNQDTYLEYDSNKCCMKYIWKGPSYFEY